MTQIAKHAVIRGRVQMVGYRDWTCAEAARLGLWGWVRNLSDGAVELIAVGEEAQVESLLSACWQGPPMAEVSEVWSELWNPEPRMPDGAPLNGFLRTV